MIRILQLNVNHSWGVQDLLMQRLTEGRFGIGIISEPRRIPENTMWFGDSDKVAAVFWDPREIASHCSLLHQGNGFVVVGNEQLIVISCYVSPRTRSWEFQEFLDRVTDCIERFNGVEMIVAGDFNAKSVLWGERMGNIKGRLLEQWANRHELRLANVGNQPTCVRPQGESRVDLTWSTPGLIDRIRDWEVLDEVSLSDHLYIVYNVLPVEYNSGFWGNRQEEEYPRWIFKDMDRDRFLEMVQLGYWERDERVLESVDEQAETLKRVVTHACDAVAKRAGRNQRKRNKYWWNAQIEEVRKRAITCRRSLTKANRTDDMDRRERARIEYKAARKELRLEIRKAKSLAWQELLNTIDKDPWGRPYRIVMAKLRKQGPSAIETLSLEKLENILEELFPGRAEEIEDPIPEEIVVEEWDNALEVTTTQVRGLLSNKKKSGKTAPGPDGFTRKLWKSVPDELLQEVRDLYNKCLRMGKFPSGWKTARLVLIPKVSGVNSANVKYRPICLLDEVGKGLERTIADRLKTFLNISRDAALSNRQYGFREGRSTIDAMIEVRRFVEDAVAVNDIVFAVSLDIKNAFNSIPWKAIIRVMREKKFPNYLIRIINSYLSDRNISFKTCDGQIRTKEVYAGVPQGSVLGPLLWNIVYDYVLKVRLLDECDIVAYADDTLVLVRARDAISATHRTNICVAMVMSRIEELGLQVATNKTEAIVFKSGRKKRRERWDIRVGHDFVEVKDSLKYLGVMFDTGLNFKGHFRYIEEKAGKVTRALWRLMPNLRGPGEAKRRLYVRTIEAVMIYAAPVWCEKFVQYKSQQVHINRIRRGAALRVISGYRTISHDAAALLARMPPFYLLAARQRRLYERIKDSKERGLYNKEMALELRVMAETIMLRQWKMDLSRPNLPGQRVIQAILPCLEEWVGRRHGSLTFHLTQLVTAHGSFGVYLSRMNRRDTEICPHCYEENDDADHTLKRCPTWERERGDLVMIVGDNLDLRSLMTRMVRSDRAWMAVLSFAEKVMLKKEISEREREAERGAVVLRRRYSDDSTS